MATKLVKLVNDKKKSLNTNNNNVFTINTASGTAKLICVTNLENI